LHGFAFNVLLAFSHVLLAFSHVWLSIGVWVCLLSDVFRGLHVFILGVNVFPF
jgi:hypothetical protein